MAECMNEIPAAARRLSEAIRFKTVTSSDPARTDHREFLAFQAWLSLAYPLCHSLMERETFGPWGILLRLAGSDATLRPMLLLAHYDVVPADGPEGWRFPPFSGSIEEGYVWGRGALDVKNTVIAVMEAMEACLAGGEKPRRGVIIALGGDEEIGGGQGAASISRRLESLGIEPEFVLDEGSVILPAMGAFIKRPVGLIGISEKGFLNLSITVRGRGGHASMPGRRTVAGDLARAVAKLEANPFPARMTPVLRLFLRACVPYLPFYMKPAFFLPRLFWPVLRLAFSKEPGTDALIRTSQAVTMLEAGSKENVLPDAAAAVANVRVLPGESCAGAAARIARLLEPLGASVEYCHPAQAAEAMAVSPIDGPAYACLVDALRVAAPEAVAIPFLVAVGTDTIHYSRLTDRIYRLMPVILDGDEQKRIHGRDERISFDNIARETAFYASLISAPR
jgi:carboxypeptidase PM20D1